MSTILDSGVLMTIDVIVSVVNRKGLVQTTLLDYVNDGEFNDIFELKKGYILEDDLMFINLSNIPKETGVYQGSVSYKKTFCLGKFGYENCYKIYIKNNFKKINYDRYYDK